MTHFIAEFGRTLYHSPAFEDAVVASLVIMLGLMALYAILCIITTFIAFCFFIADMYEDYKESRKRPIPFSH